MSSEDEVWRGIELRFDDKTWERIERAASDASMETASWVHDVLRHAVVPELGGSVRFPPCTLDNCGHMRQLDAIVAFLRMPRGTRSVLDELRARAMAPKAVHLSERLGETWRRCRNEPAAEMMTEARLFEEMPGDLVEALDAVGNIKVCQKDGCLEVVGPEDDFCWDHTTFTSKATKTP